MRAFMRPICRLMWEALDEHGVLLRRGIEPGRDQGLNRLTDIERDTVLELNRREQRAWERAKAMTIDDREALVKEHGNDWRADTDRMDEMDRYLAEVEPLRARGIGGDREDAND